VIPAERQQQILSYIKQKGDIVRIQNMVDELGISLSTIRRDIHTMVQKGELQPLRGGAVKLCGSNIELNLDAKLLMNYEEKSRIARSAAAMVADGEVIFLDPSSVNSLLIPYLEHRDVTVVTNSIAHINQLNKHGVNCILTGGQIKQSTSSCIGPVAEQTLRELHFTHCFLGANGMSLQHGLTNHDLRERTIKRIAIENATDPVFLIDSSKFGKTAMCKVAEIDEYPIITDCLIDELKEFGNILVAEN